MDNQNQVAEEKVVETETTQTNSPQVESPITGDETMQGDAVVQTPVAEESNEPKQTEAERREFQNRRLAEENRRLKEELESKPKEPSAFEPFRASTPPVQSAPIDVQSFTDPITGETNWQGLNQAQQQREQQIVQQARYEAQSAVQETLDEERARAKYPELMNNSITEKQIASRWFYEKTQGNNVSISDIADEFARNFKQTVAKAEKVGAERVLNEVSEKEKAGLTATSQTSQQAVRSSSQAEIEQLSVGTRRGDADAITARISAIPWANK
jgi:hypothetical protein